MEGSQGRGEEETPVLQPLIPNKDERDAMEKIQLQFN